MASSLKKRVQKILERDFIAGTVYRVDMDRVDVIPAGSAGALRSLPLTGDRDKIKPGDPVKVITIAGKRMALTEDVATNQAAAIAQSALTEDQQNLLAKLGGGSVAGSAGTVYSEQIGPGTVYMDQSIYDADADGVVNNAEAVGGYTPAQSGANAHALVTDASGAIKLTEISVPGTPTSGSGYLYQGSDSWPYAKNDAGLVLPLAMANMILPLNGFYLTGAVFALVASNWPSIAFRDAQFDAIDVMFVLPPGWAGRTLYCDIFVYANATGLNTVWSTEFYTNGDTGSYNANGVGGGGTLATATTIKRFSIPSGTIANLNQTQMCRFHLYRNGTHANDTYTGTAYISAIQLRVV